MLLQTWFLFCSLGSLNVQTSRAENSYQAKVRLESELLKNYRKEIRPVLNPGDNVTIIVGISLNHIKDMDDKNQILTLSLWFRQKWYDPQLTWEPSNYMGAKITHIDTHKMWTPDLKVYNEAEKRVDSGLDQFQTRAVIEYTGEVKWMAPAVMQTTCQVDVTYFPYDTQVCKLKIGSWTYDGFAIDIKPESYTMDISKSPSNPEWALVSTSVKRNVEYYPCCPEPYPDVTYTIKIKRRMQTYWVNFLFPGILLTMMTMMTFLTSASDIGERVSLVLTSLVSMFVFLKMVAERTPTSNTIPLLSIYFIILSLEIGLIFYSVCVTLNAYHKHPALGDMPGYVRNVVLGKLGKIWGLTKDGRVIRRKLDALRNCYLMKEGVRTQLEEMKSSLSKSKVSDDPGSPELCPRHRNIDNGPKHEDSTVRSIRSTGLECDDSAAFHETSFSASEDSSLPMETNNNDPKTSQPRATVSKQSSSVMVLRGPPCNCILFLQRMVNANKRMLAGLREIAYVTRQIDKTSSEKEHWLLAAAILDRTFLVLFIIIFVVLSLITFFW